MGFGGGSLEGNPYDGHTLGRTMDRIVATSGAEPEYVYCDMNYRGHDYEGECEIHVGRRRRGWIAKSVWRWMRRRAAIEPSIGHLKEERRMERCRLKGTEGNKVNAVLSAAAMNFSKLLAALGASPSLLLAQLVARFAPHSPRRTPAAAAGQTFSVSTRLQASGLLGVSGFADSLRLRGRVPQPPPSKFETMVSNLPPRSPTADT